MVHTMTPSTASALFDGLSYADLMPLFALARRRRFAAGSTVISQGTPGETLLVICEGQAEEVGLDALDGSTIRRTLGPGATLGEAGLLSGRPAAATVQAVSDLEVLALSAEDFKVAAATTP